jgi:hypothetical protein
LLCMRSRTGDVNIDVVVHLDVLFGFVAAQQAADVLDDSAEQACPSSATTRAPAGVARSATATTATRPSRGHRRSGCLAQAACGGRSFSAASRAISATKLVSLSRSKLFTDCHSWPAPLHTGAWSAGPVREAVLGRTLGRNVGRCRVHAAIRRRRPASPTHPRRGSGPGQALSRLRGNGDRGT